jgi:hypothetical protein
MMRAGTFGAPLVVHKKKTETLVTIPAKSVFTPHKSLGHYKAPAGTNHTQLNILHTNSDKCAKLVSSSPCNRMDSWYFYTAIYLKSIGYVLADCFFLAKELKQVQQAVLHAFLAKCGYNCNTHQLIVYAPIGHGGCRLTPLYLMQGEGQILRQAACSKLQYHGINYTLAQVAAFSKTSPHRFLTCPAAGLNHFDTSLLTSTDPLSWITASFPHLNNNTTNTLWTSFLSLQHSPIQKSSK